jgi:hypothetical protein
MTIGNVEDIRADPAWKSLYRIGGISFILLGIISLSAVAVFALLGPQPENPIDSYLVRFAANKLANVIIVVIFSLITVLLIPGFLALYQILKPVNRGIMLIATVSIGLAVVVSFVTTIIPNISLFYISDAYSTASTDTQRNWYITATVVARAYQSAAFLFGLIYSAVIVITSLLMRKVSFKKTTVYLGLLGGVIGMLASIPIFSSLFPIFFLLDAIWFLLVGWKIYRWA